ncbi:MAG: hypothetical protein ACYDIC_10475 [Desulfobaccales bacterium]
MNKVIILATAGIFLLSLQGASLAQEKAPTATPPMQEKQAPAAPKAEAPAAKAPEAKAPEAKTQTKAADKKAKIKQKAKARKAKKAKPQTPAE